VLIFLVIDFLFLPCDEFCYKDERCLCYGEYVANTQTLEVNTLLCAFRRTMLVVMILFTADEITNAVPVRSLRSLTHYMILKYHLLIF